MQIASIISDRITREPTNNRVPRRLFLVISRHFALLHACATASRACRVSARATALTGMKQLGVSESKEIGRRTEIRSPGSYSNNKTKHITYSLHQHASTSSTARQLIRSTRERLFLDATSIGGAAIGKRRQRDNIVRGARAALGVHALCGRKRNGQDAIAQRKR